MVPDPSREGRSFTDQFQQQTKAQQLMQHRPSPHGKAWQSGHGRQSSWAGELGCFCPQLGAVNCDWGWGPLHSAADCLCNNPSFGQAAADLSLRQLQAQEINQNRKESLCLNKEQAASEANTTARKATKTETGKFLKTPVRNNSHF